MSGRSMPRPVPSYGPPTWARQPRVPAARQASASPARRRLVTITINGVLTQAVFVGGGDHNFYALNAATGAVIWKRALGTTSSTFLWSSPLFHNGLIYEGVCILRGLPLIRSKTVALRATNGAIRDTLYTAPSGCVGASIWGSPAVDTSTGDIYFATGNGGTTCTAPLSVALVQASSSLALLGSWQVPPGSSWHGQRLRLDAYFVHLGWRAHGGHPEQERHLLRL